MVTSSPLPSHPIENKITNTPILKAPYPYPLLTYYVPQAHVCISNTSRAGAELGYDVSVLADGIGDRDIPGATAKQLVDVSQVKSSHTHELSNKCSPSITRLVRKKEEKPVTDDDHSLIHSYTDHPGGIGRCLGDGRSQ